MRRLLAIDVDGTLLSDQHTVSQRNQIAIQRAIEADVHVVLATGRQRASCLAILEQLGLQTPGLFVQGLHIADADGTLLRGKFLPSAVVRSVAQFMHKTGHGVTGYGVDKLRTEQHNRHTRSSLTRFQPILTDDLGATQQHLLITHGEPDELAALRPLLEARLGGAASAVMSSPRMLEVLPLGGSKGDGLLWLADWWGISTENMLAIGNAENDIEMLQAAGLGIAVANADEMVRNSADVIVASNNNDGVAEAIERFVLS